MVLAGQRPETVIEITSRALSFWTYQVNVLYIIRVNCNVFH